jgi:hypothetical protein
MFWREKFIQSDLLNLSALRATSVILCLHVGKVNCNKQNEEWIIIRIILHIILPVHLSMHHVHKSILIIIGKNYKV